jgi:SPX domain protein involved in polyphosphate accumulation
MKYGEYLKAGKNPDWSNSYLDYDKLKTMISDLMEAHVGEAHDTGKGASLSVSRPTNAAGMPIGAKEDHVTQEQFFSFIEQEIRKIDMFTKKQVDYNDVWIPC